MPGDAVSSVSAVLICCTKSRHLKEGGGKVAAALAEQVQEEGGRNASRVQHTDCIARALGAGNQSTEMQELHFARRERSKFNRECSTLQFVNLRTVPLEIRSHV